MSGESADDGEETLMDLDQELKELKMDIEQLNDPYYKTLAALRRPMRSEFKKKEKPKLKYWQVKSKLRASLASTSAKSEDY